MNNSIELTPGFIERYAWPLIFGLADIGIVVEIVFSFMVGNLSLLPAKIVLMIMTIPVACWCYSKSPAWFFRADLTGIYQQRYNNFVNTVHEYISWQQVGWVDRSKLVIFDTNGEEIMDLDALRQRSKKDKDTFLDFIDERLASNSGENLK